jgi:hypothetical protein
MNRNLDNYLVEKYPKIFINRHADMRETAMCWGFDHNDGWFWILDNLCESIQNYIDSNSIKKRTKNKFIRNLISWLIRTSYKRGYNKPKIVQKLLNFRGKYFYKFSDFLDKKYEKIEIETIPQVVADQVKEKFGTLNFYYHGGDDYIHGMVWLAEHMSSNTCEFCGSTKDVGSTVGWIYTICKSCYSKSENRISNLVWKPNQSIKELRRLKINQLNKIRKSC